VMTKIDRCRSEAEVHAMVESVAQAVKTLNAPTWLGPLFLVSAQAQTGLKELRSSVEAALMPQLP